MNDSALSVNELRYIQ